MNFRDDHKQPLWMERSDIAWGSNLTAHDLYMEDLDQPSRLSLLSGTADRASLDGGSGVARSGAPSFNGAPGHPLSGPGAHLRSFLTEQEARVVDAAQALADASQPPCPVCDGSGMTDPLPPTRSGPRPCSYCKGTGVKP